MLSNSKNKSKFLIYLSAILQFQGFIGPVIFVFYSSYMGLSTSQYLLCDSILFFVMAFVEIPSGMIADHFGRKKIIIISKLAICIGIVMLLTIKNFYGALAVASLYGVFGAMESGVAQSIFYEIYESDNSLDEYEGIQAKASSIGFMVSIVYATIGGRIAEINIAFPVILDLIISLISLVGIVFLLEDKRQYANSLNKMNAPSKEEVHNVIYIIIFVALLSASSRTLFSFYQPILVNVEVPVKMLGVISAGYSIVAAITAFLYKTMRERVSKKGMYIIIILLQMIVTMGLSTVNSMFVIIFILLQQVQRGVMDTFLYIETNAYIDSNCGNRVTLMSVMYCAINVIVALSLWATSMINKNYNLSISIKTYCLAINILILISCLLFVYKSKTNKIHSFQ